MLTIQISIFSGSGGRGYNQEITTKFKVNCGPNSKRALLFPDMCTVYEVINPQTMNLLVQIQSKNDEHVWEAQFYTRPVACHVLSHLLVNRTLDWLVAQGRSVAM